MANQDRGAAAELHGSIGRVSPVPKGSCPTCGSPVNKWYSPNMSDPGDVDPRADCTNPNCEWGY